MKFPSCKSEIGPSNLRIPTSKFGRSKSPCAPREQMTVRADGFATPAIKRYTSDARRLSESSTLAQKYSKHTMFLMVLWYDHLTAKIRKQKKKHVSVLFCLCKSERLAWEWCKFQEKSKDKVSKVCTALRRERNNKTTGSAAHTALRRE